MTTKVNPGTCTDLEWWQATGHCGGCGTAGCHDGPCGDVEAPDPMRGSVRVCDRCQFRRMTGQVKHQPVVGWTVRTVGELREALRQVPDDAPITWEYDGPEECCDEHVHDITLVTECDARVDVWPSRAEIRLSGGSV